MFVARRRNARTASTSAWQSRSAPSPPATTAARDGVFVPAPSDKHVHFSWWCSTIAATTVWRLVRTSRLRQASKAAFAIASASAQVLLRRFSACLMVVLLSCALMTLALMRANV